MVSSVSLGNVSFSEYKISKPVSAPPEEESPVQVAEADQAPQKQPDPPESVEAQPAEAANPNLEAAPEAPKHHFTFENRGLPTNVGIDLAVGSGFVTGGSNENNFFNGTVLRALGSTPKFNLGIDLSGQFWTTGVPPFTATWDAMFGYQKTDDFNESYYGRYGYKLISPYPQKCPIMLSGNVNYLGTNFFGWFASPNKNTVPDAWLSRSNPQISDQIGTEDWLTILPFGGKFRPAIGYTMLAGNERWFPGADYEFRSEGDLRGKLEWVSNGWDISGYGTVPGLGREGEKVLVNTSSSNPPKFDPMNAKDSLWRPMNVYGLSVATPEVGDLVSFKLDGYYKSYGGGRTPLLDQYNVGLEADFSRKFSWVDQSYVKVRYLSDPVLYIGPNSAYGIEAGFLVDPARQFHSNRFMAPMWLTGGWEHIQLPDGHKSTDMLTFGLKTNVSFFSKAIPSRGADIDPRRRMP